MNVLIRILLVLNIFYPALGVRTNRRPRINPNRFVPCPVPTINNGTVRMQRLGRVGFFHCFEGFELHGQTNNPCQSGRWKQEIPICIKPGCARPQQNVPNGWVLVDPSRQKTTLFCHDGFINAGSTTAFCNGKNWDRQLGDCRVDREHTKMCDNNFAWVRRNGWNSFEKLESGPRHDHTVGKPLEGHYIVAEATNFRSIHKSRLLSPIYNQSESVDACFRFFYHMYGANVGRLRILIKTFSDQLNDIADNPQNILFEMKESQGNQWHEKTIEIESVHDDFQIVFEATGGNGVISDIAIDDVTLLKDGECIKYLPKVEKVTEESGGIYSYQSCNETFGENGHITERCDCHQDCMDQNTCCPDYQSKCLESETESSVSTPDDDSTETNVVVTDKVTEKLPGIASNSSSVTVISTSTLIPTTASTIQSSVSTSTAIPITNATTVTSTSTLKPTTIPKPIPTVSQAINPTKRIDDISTKSTASGSSNRTKTLVISTNVPKMPNETLITSKTTNITMKAVETATKSTKIMSTVPKMTTISMNGVWKSSSTLKPTIAVKRPAMNESYVKIDRKLIPIRTLPIQGAQSIQGTQQIQRTQSVATMIWMCIIVLLCIGLTLTLIGWLRFSARNWNQFNSHKIEYKHKCICGSMVDESGTHGLSCPNAKGTWPRHLDLNHTYHRALTSAHRSSTLEPIGLSRDDGKRPDGTTLSPWSKGKRLVWDVTCVDTLAPTYLNSSLKKASSAAELACSRKHSHYTKIKAANFIFVGLAVETLGPWCKETKSFVDTIGKMLIEESGDIRAKKFLCNRISLAIQRGNAASILGTHPTNEKLTEIFDL